MTSKQEGKSFLDTALWHIFSTEGATWRCSQSLFFNKVAGLRPANLLKKRLWHRHFPVNFSKFLRTPFFTGQLWATALFLDVHLELPLLTVCSLKHEISILNSFIEI